MKWGHRKATYSTVSLGGRKTARTADSFRTQRLKKKIQENKRAINTYSKEAKKGNRYSEKVVNTFTRDNAKLNAKLIKSQYRDQYNAGRSAVGKVLDKITGADRTYAETMYNYRNIR